MYKKLKYCTILGFVLEYLQRYIKNWVNSNKKLKNFVQAVFIVLKSGDITLRCTDETHKVETVSLYAVENQCFFLEFQIACLPYLVQYCRVIFFRSNLRYLSKTFLHFCSPKTND